MIQSTATFTSFLYRAYVALRSQTRFAWILPVLLAMLIGMPSPILQLSTTASLIPSSRVNALAQLDPAASLVPSVAPSDSSNAPVTPSAQVAAPQDCTTPAYSSPAPINLSSQANGLTHTIDATTYYKVYGNTAKQIKTQLFQCAPPHDSSIEAGNFAAETGGNLSWHYDTTISPDGLCTIGNVKVGLHINMILPSWQPTGSATAGLASNWQNMIDRLTVHENEHVALYQQYANQLLSDLRSIPATSCPAFADTVAATAAGDVASLNTAQANYDAATNHGIKQGAVLR